MKNIKVKLRNDEDWIRESNVNVTGVPERGDTKHGRHNTWSDNSWEYSRNDENTINK